MIPLLKRYRPAPSPAVAVGALFMVFCGYAVATSIPSRSGVIHSCYLKNGGNLRVVPSGKHCLKDEKALAFNQRGQQGPPGLQGRQGVPGPPGPLTTSLPSGETLRGWFNIDTFATGGTQFIGGSISFGLTLSSAPVVEIAAANGTTTHCTGSQTNPTATPGYLCLYEHSVSTNTAAFFTCNTSGCPGSNVADPFGAELSAESSAAGRFYVDGAWAVTAP